jgi:cytochrome c oxidase assembly protein subunit 15
LLFTVALIFLQLMIGATMRHQHAGLAIPDFPTAYGALWPDMSAEAVARYNADRVEVSAHNPITVFQIGLQMAHRIMALTITALVAVCFWRSKGGLRRLLGAWFGLILVQAGLGMWTIWSNKAADVATLHVITGALSLVLGFGLWLVSPRAGKGA